MLSALGRAPDFVMGNVLCALTSHFSGLGDEVVYYDRVKEALAQDANRGTSERVLMHREGLHKE